MTKMKKEPSRLISTHCFYCLSLKIPDLAVAVVVVVKVAVVAVVHRRAVVVSIGYYTESLGYMKSENLFVNSEIRRDFFESSEIQRDRVERSFLSHPVVLARIAMPGTVSSREQLVHLIGSTQRVGCSMRCSMTNSDLPTGVGDYEQH